MNGKFLIFVSLSFVVAFFIFIAFITLPPIFESEPTPSLITIQETESENRIIEQHEVEQTGELVQDDEYSSILTCEPIPRADLSLEDFIAQSDQFRERLEDVISQSTNVDDSVIAAVLKAGDDKAISIDALSSISNSYPQNQLAALHVLSSCTKDVDNAACNENAIGRAIIVDRDNGVMWSLVASMYYEQHNIEGAVLALQEAVAAPNYEDYFGIHLEQLQYSLSAMSNDEPLHRTQFRAMNLGLRLSFENYKSVLNMCNNHTAELPKLADACLNFGIRMEEQASTLLGAGKGRAIQETTHLALGNADAAQKISDSVSAQALDWDVLSEFNKAATLLEHDDQLANEWFQNLIIFGETEAQVYLIEEAKRLSSNPNYNPCR